jgi:coatomer subunit beta'
LCSYFSGCSRALFLLGYLPKENRIYLADKDANIVSFGLSLSVLEYQTAVLRGDLEAAERILPEIPPQQRTKVARFLEAQGELRSLPFVHAHSQRKNK